MNNRIFDEIIQYLFDTDGTTDVVRLSVLAASVPVPAAVWLFGTAVLGLFGFRRKVKATAVA